MEISGDNEARQGEKDHFLLPVMNALAAFEMVAATGNVSETARRAGTSQSAVSRHIRNLEEHLGTDLFQRVNRRMVLTREGEELARAVADGMAIMRDKAWETARGNVRRKVTINAGYAIAHYWLFELFPALQRAFPDLELALSVSQTGLAADGPEADLTVRIGDGQWKGRESALLVREDVVLACAPGFLEDRGLDPTRLRPSDIRNLPLLHMDQGEYGCLWFRDWFNHSGLEYEPSPRTLYYNSYPVTLQAAAEGKGICLLWQRLNWKLLEDGMLTAIPGSHIGSRNGYYLTSRPDYLLTPGVAAVKRWLHSHSPEQAWQMRQQAGRG